MSKVRSSYKSPSLYMERNNVFSLFGMKVWILKAGVLLTGIVALCGWTFMGVGVGGVPGRGPCGYFTA